MVDALMIPRYLRCKMRFIKNEAAYGLLTQVHSGKANPGVWNEVDEVHNIVHQ